jgi:hypothetical protein
MGILAYMTGGGATLITECDKIAEISPNDTQQVASILQRMIVSYYQDVRQQALMAFLVAVGLEIVAVFFFVLSAIAAIFSQHIAVLTTVSGLLVQVMTGIVFYLYRLSAKQFGGFHICLERTNRFLLANAMAGQLPEAECASKRAEVVTAVLNAPMLTLAIMEQQARPGGGAARRPAAFLRRKVASQ